MGFLDKLLGIGRKPTLDGALLGAPIIRATAPPGYIDRQITAPIIAANREVPIVLSSLTGLSRICFGGFDWHLESIDGPDDDTKAPQIDAALKQIKLIDKRIGRVGRARKVGTLGCVRAAALESWSWGKAVFEYGMKSEAGWIEPTEIQCLPGQSFARAPSLYGENILSDALLKGIIYDTERDMTRFFQSATSSVDPVELNPDNVLFLVDPTIPDGTSMLKTLNPSIEQWKEIRYDAMLTEHRVGVPNEIAQIEPADVEKMATIAPTVFSLDELIKYAKSFVQSQGNETAKVSLGGMRVSYPNISVPLDPWQADKYLKEEILAFFFKKDILEVTAQAISATNAPSKALLDIVVSSEREIHGKPFEDWWNEWLELNGFGDLKLTFSWWNWTPTDQEAERLAVTSDFTNGGIGINEFRAKRDYPALEPDEITKLIDEYKTLRGRVATPFDQNQQQNPVTGAQKQ